MLLAGALGALGALGLTAAAVPAGGAAPTPPPAVHVEQGPQTSGPLDLAAATLVELHGRLELTITTRGDWTPGMLVPARRRRLCLTVTGSGGRPTTACVARVPGGVGLRIAGRVTPVASGRPDARTLVLRIDPALLGLTPGALTWEVTSAWTDAGPCPPAAACHGRLPAAGPASYRLVATPAIGCRRTGPGLRYNGPRSKRVVALTFDDGPWTDTPAFVGVLERERVPGTFFMIGRQVAGHGALLERELADGDALGNHTYTHPPLTRTGDAVTQLAETTAAIDRAAGYRPCVFRPPYGDENPGVVAAALAQGMSTIVWDVDPSDYARPGTPAIVDRILSAARSGSIILMHDGGGPRGQTLAALPRVIAGLRARGYGFATVPELLGYETLYA
ncbi:MAG: peptidoglycan-N-acetylglucosamine deacetylase [Solirubrobacteraceae bacterium]|nr:peptidoglycan-N-acetylglucosamine deacetylase [Solirubrobacteraceae bacterium]